MLSTIRTLISEWVEAYQDLDAKRLAAIETPDVEILDRFGELHLPSGRNENEKLWSDAFAIVSRNPHHQRSRVTVFGFFGQMSPWCRRLGDLREESCLPMKSVSLHFHRSILML